MATYRHPKLPGQFATGYSDEAAAILGQSGWVDINTPEPQPEVSTTHPDGESEAAEAEPADPKKKK